MKPPHYLGLVALTIFTSLPHHTLSQSAYSTNSCSLQCAETVTSQKGCVGNFPCFCSSSLAEKIAACIGARCPEDNLPAVWIYYADYCRQHGQTLQVSEGDFISEVGRSSSSPTSSSDGGVPTDTSTSDPGSRSSGGSKLSTGAIVGIAFGAAALIILALLAVFLCFFLRRRRRRRSQNSAPPALPSYTVPADETVAPVLAHKTQQQQQQPPPPQSQPHMAKNPTVHVGEQQQGRDREDFGSVVSTSGGGTGGGGTVSPVGGDSSGAASKYASTHYSGTSHEVSALSSAGPRAELAGGGGYQ